MHLGRPIFTGKEEIEQFFCIMEVLGLPPNDLLDKSTKKEVVCENIKKIANSGASKFKMPGVRPLKSIFNCNDSLFIDLITSKIYIELLSWDPCSRLSAKSALNHAWFNKDIGLQYTSSLSSLKKEDFIIRSNRRSLTRKETLNKYNNS